MKTFIQHYIKTHKDLILEKSIIDCHCKGVHSLLFVDSPEHTIRMYYAEKGSDLKFNFPEYYQGKQSIAFHPHHCSLTLHVLAGEIWNWTVKKNNNA